MLWAAALLEFEPAEASSARERSQAAEAPSGAAVQAAPWSQRAERRSRVAVQRARVAELSP